MQKRSFSTNSDAPAMDRRQFVSMLGLGGLGLAFGPTLQQFANLFSPAAVTGDFGLPQEWFTILGPPLKGYAAFLGGLQLKHVSVKQIIEPHLKLRGEVRSGIPPAGMWARMRPTLLVADQIAARLGEPVETVISAYRSPAYNARCPGASKCSQHMNNIALDLVFASSPRQVAKAARSIRDEGKFRGGIGQYPNFTHVDTRGTNANWG